MFLASVSPKPCEPAYLQALLRQRSHEFGFSEQEPTSDCCFWTFEEAQHAARAMDEQCTDIGIATFADPKQRWMTARGMLPRHYA
jgi:hypothetical protein